VGKSIVVTGAGKGLGKAIARRLAAEGNTLILLGRTLSKVEAVASELGHGSYAVECDVGSPASVRTAFATVAEKTPVIDVLINNAGVYEPFTVAEATDAQIEAAVQTNYAGPIYCSREAIPLMRKGSHIINISSESINLPFVMFSLYQSSKAGLERFTETLCQELKPEGIAVTMFRAGQMMDEDSSNNWPPEIGRRFHEGNLRAGLDLRARPISSFGSVAEFFPTLINLPADVSLPIIQMEARHR
jgi:meso-butanediol dehydrogenase / (S,S)-butanediol dehydrogenase / diacetyl reductase